MRVAESRHVASGEAQIYYEVYGPADARTIMLVPGGDESHLHYFQNVPALLAAGYRVILMNLRGHWLSPCPPAFCHFRFFKDDFLAILDAEGIEHCVMMCCSLGGWGGLRMAVHHPERVEALALCGSSAGIWSEQNRQTNTRAFSMIRRMMGTATPRPADTSAPLTLLDRYFSLLGSEDGMVSAPLSVVVAMEDDASWLQTEALADYSVPTLLIGGDTDDFLGCGFQRHTVTLIPGAELSEFQASGHRPFWSHPDEFNRALLSWLELRGLVAAVA